MILLVRLAQSDLYEDRWSSESLLKSLEVVVVVEVRLRNMKGFHFVVQLQNLGRKHFYFACWVLILASVVFLTSRNHHPSRLWLETLYELPYLGMIVKCCENSVHFDEEILRSSWDEVTEMKSF